MYKHKKIYLVVSVFVLILSFFVHSISNINATTVDNAGDNSSSNWPANLTIAKSTSIGTAVSLYIPTPIDLALTNFKTSLSCNNYKNGPVISSDFPGDPYWSTKSNCSFVFNAPLSSLTLVSGPAGGSISNFTITPTGNFNNYLTFTPNTGTPAGDYVFTVDGYKVLWSTGSFPSNPNAGISIVTLRLGVASSSLNIDPPSIFGTLGTRTQGYEYDTAIASFKVMQGTNNISNLVGASNISATLNSGVFSPTSLSIVETGTYQGGSGPRQFKILVPGTTLNSTSNTSFRSSMNSTVATGTLSVNYNGGNLTAPITLNCGTGCTPSVSFSVMSTTADGVSTFGPTTNPITITKGDKLTFNWSSAYMGVCFSSGEGFSTGGAISGQDDAYPTQTGTYSVICTNSAGSSITKSIDVTVNVLTSTLNVNIVPSSIEVIKGGSAINSSVVTTSENVTGITYRILKDNDNIIGEMPSNTQLSVSANDVISQGIYSVTVQAFGITPDGSTIPAQDTVSVSVKDLPSCSTVTPATNITHNTATVSGNVISDGGATITSRGIIVSTSTTSQTTGAATVAGTTGIYSRNLVNLAPNTTYHYRAWATNSVGTCYGNDETFRTLPTPKPDLTASAPTQNTATVGVAKTFTSTISNIGNSDTVNGFYNSMEVADDVDGVDSLGLNSTSPSPMSAIEPDMHKVASGTYTFNIAKEYSVRFCADTNTSWGGTVTELDPNNNCSPWVNVDVSCASGTVWNGSACVTNVVPTVTSPTSSSIGFTSATLGANVTSLGVPASISERGVCWRKSSDPYTASNCIVEGGTTTGVFTVNVTGLTQSTNYVFKGYARNATGYGIAESNFTTLSPTSGTLTGTDCTIPAGSPSCPTSLTLNVTNPVAGAQTNVTKPTNVEVISNTTINNTFPKTVSNITVLPPSTTFYLNHNGSTLNPSGTTINATCATGSTWNGTICATNVYTVTGTAGPNCSISPASRNVNYNSTTTFTITPNSGYSASATGCNGSLSGTTYTTGAITSSCTVSATCTAGPVNGVCDNTSLYGCTAGTSDSHVDGSTSWTWSCLGLNGGTNATNCSKSKSVSTVTTTTPATNITYNSATISGNVTSDGGSAITSRSVAFGTSSNPTGGTAITGTTGAYSRNITGLSPNTTYHYRAWATNSVGTGYGTDETFTTSSAPVMSGNLVVPSCTITAGNPSCPSTASWSITNPEGNTTAITASGMTDINVSNSTSPTSQSGNQTVTIPYSSRTFYLYNNAKSLVPTSPNGSGVIATASCDSGLGWDSAHSICASYTITFNGNGNTSGSTASQTIASGGIAFLRPNGFVKNGYNFNGWNTLSNGTGTSYADQASYTMGTSNVTLYAIWTLADTAPTVSTTTPITNITQTTATGGGTTVSNGGTTVTQAGIVWSTTANPTTVSNLGITYNGWALGGPWTSSITGLSPSTTYHVRAYAINNIGTSYGADVTFTTATASLNGVCAATHYNCTAGTPASNVNGSTSYTWSCVGSNGGSTAYCTEDKTGNPGDGLNGPGDGSSLSGTLSATPCTIADGASSCLSTVTWTTSNPVSGATSAVTSPINDNGASAPDTHVSVPDANSGNESVVIPYNSRSFYLYHNASLLASAVVNVGCATGLYWNESICTSNPDAIPSPTATLRAVPSQIAKGNSSTLTWSSTNATSCTGTNFSTSGVTPNAINGSVSVSPEVTTTYSINCVGDGGQAPDQATVTVKVVTGNKKPIFKEE